MRSSSVVQCYKMITSRMLSHVCRRGKNLNKVLCLYNQKYDIHKFSKLTIGSESSVNLRANFDVFQKGIMTSPQRRGRNNSEPTVRKVIFTQCAPKPVGPYSQAVQFGNTLFASGVLGMDKNKMELVEGGVGNQTKQALINLGHILKAAGTTYENVIKVSIFLADIGDFKEVNEVYKDFFTTNPPARSTYQVGALPLGALVEIEVIAGTGEIEQTSCNCSSKI